uniref:C-type lectin domain-containing protein n=1 Tax=Salarias fasciatus TaxID=181472 RepID=A0A672HW90_SALFA
MEQNSLTVLNGVHFTARYSRLGVQCFPMMYVAVHQELWISTTVLGVLLSSQGWKYFCSSLYYVSSTRKTWQKSRNDCLSRGADLMIIDSREEQDFLRRLSKEMWIGLTDGAQEGTWRWVDGTLLNTSYWIPGQPDNNDKGKEENCAEIHICGSWNDKSCGLQNHWICEKKVAP